MRACVRLVSRFIKYRQEEIVYACAIDLRTLCKELREKCVNSVSKAFLIQGLYLKLAGLASHTSKMHLLSERD